MEMMRLRGEEGSVSRLESEGGLDEGLGRL